MEEVIQTELETYIRDIYTNPLEKDSGNNFFIFPFLEILSELYKENTYLWMNDKLKKKHRKNATSYEALKSLTLNEDITIEEKYKELYDDDFTKHGEYFNSAKAILIQILRTDNWLQEYIYFKSLDTKGVERPLYKIKEEKIEEVRECIHKFKAENEQKIRDMILMHIAIKGTKPKKNKKVPKTTKEERAAKKAKKEKEIKDAKIKKAAGNIEISRLTTKFQVCLKKLEANTKFGDWLYTGERILLRVTDKYGYRFQNLKDEDYFFYFFPRNDKDRRLVIHTDPMQYSSISYELIHGRNYSNENGTVTITETGLMNVGHKRPNFEVQKLMENKGLKENIITRFNINNLENEFHHILADILKWADYRKQVREDYMNEDVVK